MKIIILISFLFLASTARTQIIIDSFRVIFPASKNLYSFDTINRFTPISNEIDIADEIAEHYISLNRNKYYWTNEIKNYHNYFKQYVGLILENKKVIFINAALIKFGCFLTYICDAKGGGSGFFKIKVDLKNHSAFDLSVNAPK